MPESCAASLAALVSASRGLVTTGGALPFTAASAVVALSSSLSIPGNVTSFGNSSVAGRAATDATAPGVLRATSSPSGSLLGACALVERPPSANAASATHAPPSTTNAIVTPGG